VFHKTYSTNPNRVLLVGTCGAEMMIYRKSKCKRISGVNPKHGQIMDLADLKFKSGSFDLVHACHVLEHVEKLSKAMEEVYRVLQPKGAALFCVPIPRRPKSIMRSKPDKQGHWWLVGDNWPQVYKEAGFKVVTHYGRDSNPNKHGIKADNRVDLCIKE